MNKTLAIKGGAPVRTKKMPARFALAEGEISLLMEAINYYKAKGEDPGYQGIYEERYCNEFCEYMGGGYADGVSCGTAGIWIGLKAFDLEPGAEVLISPVTDSGPLSAIILQGLKPVVIDAAPKSFNIGVEEFLARITPRTRAAVIIHAAGEPVEIDRIVEEAHKRNILVLEDCSQAPGAHWKGTKVGAFGDYAAYSTMYRKNLAAGGSSGIVYSKNFDLYRKGQSHADRGKPVWKSAELDLRNPAHAFFPALNFNTDEIRCAIGLASLRRLQDCIDKRLLFLEQLIAGMKERCQVLTPYKFHKGFSPFYFPIYVDTNKISCTKIEFAEALLAEGIGLGTHYGCLISTWPWAQPYLSDDFVTKNAIEMANTSFNLYVNEQYGEEEVRDTLEAMSKVEAHFLKLFEN
jgi:perosamine synthetase